MTGRRPVKIIPGATSEVVIPITQAPFVPILPSNTPRAPKLTTPSSDQSVTRAVQPKILDVSGDAEVPAGATLEITCIVSNVEDLNVSFALNVLLI